MTAGRSLKRRPLRPRRRFLQRGAAAALVAALLPVSGTVADGVSPGPPGLTIGGGRHGWPNARAVAVSGDGALVAGASVDTERDGKWSDAGRVAIWETVTGRLVREIETRGDVLQVRFSADDRSLIVGSVRTLGDAVDDDATSLHAIDGSVEPVRFPGSGVFAVAPRGDDLLLADPHSLCVRLSLPRGDDAERIASIRAASRAESLAYSADGGSFAVLYRTREPVDVSTGGVERALVRLRGLAVCDSASMQPKALADTDSVGDCTALDLAVEGKWVATGHRDGTVRLWSGTTLERLGMIRGEGGVPAFATFSPDGSELAVLSQPLDAGERPACRLAFHRVPGLELVRRFDFEDGGVPVSHARREAAALNPRRLAYLPGGGSLVVGVGGVSLVDTATGRVERRFDRGADGLPTAGE